MTPWAEIVAAIGETTDGQPVIRQRIPLSGGSINTAYRVETTVGDYFVKLNDATRLDMFQAEADGLRDLAAVDHGPRIPVVITHGVAAGRSFLVLEWINLRGRGDWAALGTALAHLHGQTGEQHGWHRDNTIGSTPQPNSQHPDWCSFFAGQRLGFQLSLAEQSGASTRLLDRGQRLQDALPALLAGHAPAPSLLHGDLWSGNVAFDETGAPVLYDPATHYGDRECDLAMSELFGRFPEACYAAYESVWPIDPGYAIRRDLYQLYHVLNHFNLFGSGYSASAQGLVDRLLAVLEG
jgi:protein-ribulosamine 3-kinase